MLDQHTAKSGRPEPTEYSDYARRYVDLVPGDDAIGALKAQIAETLPLFRGIGEERAGTLRYAPGKWSVKQVVGHMSDTERIFTYRALCIGRGDSRPLAGFDQDDYMRDVDFDQRSLDDLLDEFRVIREATIALFTGFSADAWMRRGTASGAPCSVRGLAFVTAGHELHHVKVLKEKYLTA